MRSADEFSIAIGVVGHESDVDPLAPVLQLLHPEATLEEGQRTPQGVGFTCRLGDSA